MNVESGKPLAKEILECEVEGSAGKACKLHEVLVASRPALLVFVRQFACAGCSERMTELLIHADILQTSGVDVIVIGCGSVEHAKGLADSLSIGSRPGIKIVTDPTLKIHRTVGLHRSPWGVLGARGTWNLVKAMSNGHKNAWGHGDFFQLGGTILLDEKSRVVIHHEEKHLGETLPLGDVVEKALMMLAMQSAIAV